MDENSYFAPLKSCPSSQTLYIMSKILSIVYLYCFAVNLHSGSSRILLAPARQMVKAIGLYPFTDISNTLRLIAALAFLGV